ncbi:MAG: hypothetical protein JXB62_17935 [Pirellulales bacterium]|nr:hypothetical protein [Pirellulales bacterium]
MSRVRAQDTDAPGHDSFLDIVANMVGILIILVMVAGVRVKNAPVAAIVAATERERLELETEQAAARSVRGDVLRMAEEIETLKRETSLRRRQRDALAGISLALEEQVRTRREQMDAETRQRFDLARSLDESRAELESLSRRRRQAESVPVAPIRIESYPTPLSKPVDGREAHFLLQAGRIAVIPLDDLISRLKDDAQRQAYKLQDLPELTHTVGPVRGFRLRYTLARRDISPEVAMATGRSGSYAELTRWTLIPVSGRMGEPVETAWSEGSEFRQALAPLDPARSTVTFWTYPDSFDLFRRLKKELFNAGYAVAARPLPHGVPISGSPHGSKSAAE